MRLAGLSLQLPAIDTGKLHLLMSLMVHPVAIIFLLISLFSGAVVLWTQAQPADKCSAAGKELSHQIHLPAQAVSEEPLQTPQAVQNTFIPIKYSKLH